MDFTNERLISTNDPDGSKHMEKLQGARNLLHDSKNPIARSFLGRVFTCTDDEIGGLSGEISKAHEDNSISNEEFEALKTMLSHIIMSINAVAFDDKSRMMKDMRRMINSNKFQSDTIVQAFKRRIWHNANTNSIIQFRNSVTDMYMLEFLELEEYVELNNEIDRYIQYVLSSGGVK